MFYYNIFFEDLANECARPHMHERMEVAFAADFLVDILLLANSLLIQYKEKKSV